MTRRLILLILAGIAGLLVYQYWPCEPLYGMVSPSVHAACVIQRSRR